MYGEDGYIFPRDRAEPKQKHTLATRIMSNGVEVIVADANGESVPTGTKSKLLRELPTRPLTLTPSTISNNVRMTISLAPDQILPNSTEHQKQMHSLLSSSKSTSTEKRSSPQTLIPHHGLQLRHNYVIKTCFTTFTYLTTLIHKSKTIVSTYETVVSTVTTEPFQIHPTATFAISKIDPTNELFQSTKNIFDTNIISQKIDDNFESIERESLEDDDIIEPSEVSPSTSSCSSSSCPCTVTLTESLKSNVKTSVIDSTDLTPVQLKRSPPKSSKYASTIMDIEPTSVKNEENTQKTKVPSKPSVTNEIVNKNITHTENNPDKETNKPPKTKFQVSDLLKLGTLGIKKLAPMIEQMTDNLKRRQEINKHASSSTVRPVTKITPYVVNKRVDTIEAESKSPGNFPIYIPVDDMDLAGSESQNVYVNSSLHQNIVWASQNLKTSRTNLAVSKPVHESPLVNGGIPISPGEIITANSDVIVGKPAAGGPNIPMHHNVPDSHIQSSNNQDIKIKSPPRGQGLKHIPFIREDDTYDLRPPMMIPNTLPPLPPPLNNINKSPDQSSQHSIPVGNHYKPLPNNIPSFLPPNSYQVEIVKSESVPYKGGPVIQTIDLSSNNQQQKYNDQVQIQPPHSVLENHGRPALLDYIPALDSPASYQNYLKTNSINRKNHELNLQNNKSGKPHFPNDNKTNNKQFLVDIQPSRVANVIIPHGSTTALVFAGSSEPHKNGQYIDDPLPYSEPGYFGSFSIDAPHLASVQVGNKQSQHTQQTANSNRNEQKRPIIEHSNVPLKYKPNPSIVNHGVSGFNQEGKPSAPKWKFDHQRYPPPPPNPHGNFPPPTSNQQTTMHFGPHVVLKHEQHINNHQIPPPSFNPENYYFGNTIKSTTLGYEGELVVPPPPPPKPQVKYESNVGVINSDFNKFKNEQHQHQHHQRPHLPPPGRPGLYDNNKFASNEIYAPQHLNNPTLPKVTSEVYYASTGNVEHNHNNQHLPVSHNNQNIFDKHKLNQGNQIVPHDNIRVPIEHGNFVGGFNGGLVTLNAATKVNAPINQHVENQNLNPQPALSHIGNRYNIPQEGGFVTLNAGTNVQGNTFPEQTISGSSVPVSLNDNSPQTFNAHAVKNINRYSEDSAAISIGTNFAISVAPNGGELNTSYVPLKPQSEKPQLIIGDNSWKTSSINDNSDDYEDINTGGIPDNVLNGNQKVHIVHASTYNDFNQVPTTTNATNNQVNFPVTKEPFARPNITKNKQDNFISESQTSNKNNNQRPVVVVNKQETIFETPPNKQKPILQLQSENKKPKVSQPKFATTTPKIIPLSFDYDNNARNEAYGQRIPTPGIPPMSYNWQVSENSNQNQDTLSEIMEPPPLTTQPFNPSYTPSNYRGTNKYKQTIPSTPLYATNAINNVDTYINAFSTADKYPQTNGNQQFVSSTPNSLTSSVIFKPFRNTTQSRDELLVSSENDYKWSNNNDRVKIDFNANHNIGSQTEKPFNDDKYKVVSLVTLPGIRPTSNPVYNRPITQMSPRPFSVNEYRPHSSGSNELPQPRPFQKLPTSQNTTKETDKIITSSVHISTNKPIKVVNISSERIPSTLPTFTTSTPAKNDSIGISDDLSPPPLPTITYPTTNDETIMGMSPPPKVPSTKIPSGEVSTYKSPYNPYKRPDYYKTSSRPFNRYATASTIIRPKPPAATTITRIVYPPNNSGQNWRNPSGVQSSINTTPVMTVGSEIMHPETYPEETLGVVISSTLPSSSIIFPSRVQSSGIFATVITNSNSGITAPTIINAPSVVRSPNYVQSSFHENTFRSTEPVRPTESLETTYRQRQTETTRRVTRPSKTVSTTVSTTVTPVIQTAANELDDISVVPLNYNNQEKKYNEINRRKPSEQVTVITHTTTLAEPASTIMTTRFVTLTHTLTVTQTKTSLVSPVVGSTTQTLILTNTQTSTVVDVVTEIHTLVQPTTIVQTVTKHIPLETTTTKIPIIEPTIVRKPQHEILTTSTLDDVSLSSDEDDLIIYPDNSTDHHLQNNETEQSDNDNFFVVMKKSQSGGALNNNNVNQQSQEEGATRNEEASNEGVSHVIHGEILLAGPPYLESPHPILPTGTAYGKECQPDCKASRNERCQRIHGLMKCVCRPGFARMFPDRPCKPTYTYSMKLALNRYGNERLLYLDSFSDQNSSDFHVLANAAHEGINRMIMQSDLRDVYHGVHVNGFQSVDIPASIDGPSYKGVINDFYVQLSDNAHEDRLKDVIEKYLRNNNYSLGGMDIYASSELVDKLEVGDFNECVSPQFHDCSEHAECFNLRATYTCSCKEGYADLSVNPLYPGRICSDSIGCEKCHYHGTCYGDDNKVRCECFQWYSGEHCQINLKVILISLATLGAILLLMLIICMAMTCARKKKSSGNRPPSQARPANIMVSCLTPIHQGGMQSSKMHPPMDKRALIQERGNDSGGEGSSIQNMSLPYVPTKKVSQASQKSGKKTSMVMEEQPRDKKPFTLMIPRAKYCPAPVASALSPEHRDSNAGIKRKPSDSRENAESKLLSYLDAGPSGNDNFIRRKQSNESSYSITKTSHQKYSAGALVSAGFKVSTTVMGGGGGDGDSCIKDLPDDVSSITKSNTYGAMDMQSQFNSLRKAYSQEDLNDWTDAERRIGELTMSEVRSFDGTIVKPSTKIIRSTTGSNKSSAHYTQHEANTMAERDLGSTFLLPHVHLYKPDLGSDGSEFDSI